MQTVQTGFIFIHMFNTVSKRVYTYVVLKLNHSKMKYEQNHEQKNTTNTKKKLFLITDKVKSHK